VLHLIIEAIGYSLEGELPYVQSVVNANELCRVGEILKGLAALDDVLGING
jgi:hypothetical protein